MFFVIDVGSPDTEQAVVAAKETLRDARKEADRLHESTGKHFVVMSMKVVWTTQTLDDLNIEGEAA